jgi:hypothetical protein
MAYPSRHIEADNRLSWMLGRLEEDFGRDARYVHLTRDPSAVATSFESRYGTGIIEAYRSGVLMDTTDSRASVCEDYVRTVTANIKAFLADKPHKMSFRLENAKEDWEAFWNWICAEGDYHASLAEWDVTHNSRSRPRKLLDRLAARAKPHP